MKPSIIRLKKEKNPSETIERARNCSLLRSWPRRITRRCLPRGPPPTGSGRSLGSDQWRDPAGPLPQPRAASLIIQRSNTATPVLWCRCTELRTRREISSVLPAERLRWLLELCDVLLARKTRGTLVHCCVGFSTWYCNSFDPDVRVF